MTRPAWKWIAAIVVSVIHDEQISSHGGGAGVRDQGLVDSALAHPMNLAAYGQPDVADLAASYVCGIAKNHGFVDGNKRTAWVVGTTFVVLNGYKLVYDDADVVLTIEGVASGAISERQLADWFRARIP